MKRTAFYLIVGALIPLSLWAAVALGSEPIRVREVAAVLWQGVRGHEPHPEQVVAYRIVWGLRLPRALLAMIVGGGLATVGVAMQALVRNPLAEPYILGISSGASAGASVFYLGFLPPIVSLSATLPVAAFLGGMGAIALVFAVARTGGTITVSRLLLAGVAVSSLMGSVTSFVTLASPDADRVRTVLFWLMGSFSRAGWGMLPLPAAVTVFGLIALQVLSRPLDALLTGEEPAFNLGVPVETLKRLLIGLSALITGTLVAASGAIGFVGLIVPHALRAILGIAHRRLIPSTFVAGALFLLWADLGARTLLDHSELPVGILTALCGVPFFLVLLHRGHYRFG